MSLLRKSKSLQPSSKGHVLSQGEYNAVTMDLHNWEIPRIAQGKFYKKEIFKLFPDYSIQSVEKKQPLQSYYVRAKLLNSTNVKKYIVPIFRTSKYSYVHIGMVQIGVKTLTTKASNGSVTLCLHDERISKLEDSVLGFVHARLDDGPIYFNCFPNQTLSLRDPGLFEALTLDVIINGVDQDELPLSSQPIILSYRVCYKLMKTAYDTKALAESPAGKTQFFQRSLKTAKVVEKSYVWGLDQEGEKPSKGEQSSRPNAQYSVEFPPEQGSATEKEE